MKSLAIVGACGAMVFSQVAQAATVTDTFNVTIVIQADCAVTAPAALDFGTVGVLSANTDATADIQVVCTSSTAYEIGLDAGTTAGGTTTDRLMTDGSNTVTYRLYQDASRTVNWGETLTTDTLSSTGTGATQSHTVYGRVPSQTTPAAGSYSDTITVTVTF